VNLTIKDDRVGLEVPGSSREKNSLYGTFHLSNINFGTILLPWK